MKDYLQNLLQRARDNSYAEPQQLSLGQLISEIEKCGIEKDNGGDKTIGYDNNERQAGTEVQQSSND